MTSTSTLQRYHTAKSFAYHTLKPTNSHPQETKVLAEVENFITTLEASPAFETDLAALEADLPASIVQEAESNPDALIDDLVQNPTELPALVSAVPTSVLDPLETFLAKPIKAIGDVESYLEALAAEPEVSSVLSVLMTAVPTSVQDAFETKPAEFLQNLVTATALPLWVTDIPAPLQSDIGSVVNKGLSIIDADFEGTAVPTFASSGFLPSGVATPTATGSVSGSNGTNPASSPIPFVGAAAPMKTVAIGAVALFAGFGVLLAL